MPALLSKTIEFALINKFPAGPVPSLRTVIWALSLMTSEGLLMIKLPERPLGTSGRK